MANTTNYNWETPDDTDLVKDGAAAIRTLGSSIDTTTKALNPETTLGDIAYRSSTSNTNTRLAIGSAGQVLTVAAGVPTWASPSDQTPLTTKGDVFTFSTVDARLGVGANGTVLTADSAETTGLKWAAPAASSGPAFSAYRATSVQSISAATNTKIQYNTEDFDTDSCYDNTTNYRFTPNKAGKYQVNFVIACQDNGGSGWAYIYKNGSLFKGTEYNAASDATIWCSNNVLMDLNGTTDYIEVFVYMDQAQQFKTANGGGHFSAIWIRS
jgi:hypothetical protein